MTEFEEPDHMEITELEDIHRMVSEVKISPEIIDIFLQIRDKIQTTLKFSISDRRIKAALKILKAKALLEYRNEVEASDLFVLTNIFWDHPENIDKIRTIVISYSNAEIGEIFNFKDMAQSVFENGLRTGKLSEALEKLNTYYKTVESYNSSAGRKIKDEISHLKSQLEDGINSQKDLSITVIQYPSSLEFRVAYTCSTLFDKKSFRNAGFVWARKKGYWRTWGDVNNIEGSIKDLRDKILLRLGVDPKFKILQEAIQETEDTEVDENPSGSPEE